MEQKAQSWASKQPGQGCSCGRRGDAQGETGKKKSRREDPVPEGQSKQLGARVGKAPSDPEGTDGPRLLLLARGDGRGLAPSAPRVTPSLLPARSGRRVLLTGCRAIDAICLCPGGFLVMEDASINTRESSKRLETEKKKGKKIRRVQEIDATATVTWLLGVRKGLTTGPCSALGNGHPREGAEEHHKTHPAPAQSSSQRCCKAPSLGLRPSRASRCPASPPSLPSVIAAPSLPGAAARS